MPKKKKKIIRKKNLKNNAPKSCYFCKEKKEPQFSETQILSRFITDRSKIISAENSGLCAKHQKKVAISIKHARHLALLPFVIST